MASKLEKPPQKAVDPVEEFLSQLPYPMLGLDEKRRLTSRNFSDTVNIHTPRKQASIDPLLSSADRKRLDSLADGEETVVELRGESTRSAIVARRRDGYLVALRDLTATLASKLARRGCEPPPFFRLTVGQIDRMRTQKDLSDEDLRTLRRNIKRMVRCNLELGMYLRFTEDLAEKTPLCDATAQLQRLLATALRMLNPNGFRPSVKLHDAPQYVRAASDELCYAAATLLSVAAEHTRSREFFQVRSDIFDDEYIFSVCFEPAFGEELRGLVLSGDYESGLETVCGGLFFDLLVLKKLAECNGWRFAVGRDGESEDVLRMMLLFPCTRSDALRLEEPSDCEPLLRLLLLPVLLPD